MAYLFKSTRPRSHSVRSARVSLFRPNAMKVIPLLHPDLWAGFEQCVTRHASLEKRNTWFDFRYGANSRNGNEKKAGDFLYELKAGEVGQNFVHRAQFLDEMVKLVPEGTVSFGKALEEIEETQEGVKLRFSDGTSATATAVIGCDGIRSRVRQVLLGKENLSAYARFVGEYAYRGLMSMETARELVGNDLAGSGPLYLGYGGYAVMYPIERGKSLNLVAIHATDEPWEHKEWIFTTSKEKMMEDFKHWGKTFKLLLNHITSPDLWGLFDVPPAETYFRGNKICLLGDSAHASTPHQGSGAGLAMEDAYVLSNLLGTIGKGEDLEKAFKIYDGIRRTITQKQVTKSRESGKLYEFKLEGIEDDPVKIIQNIGQRFKWL